MGEAKRRRDLSITLPEYRKHDWSQLDIPDCRVYLSAHMDGVPRFTLGWDATSLAAMFPKLDATEGLPQTLNWIELRMGQEAIRQSMIATSSEQELRGDAMIMAWFGLVRIPAKDFRDMTQELRQHKEYYIHAIYRGNQWVFFGSPKEASNSDISAVLHAAYPEKFPAIH